MIKNFPNFKAFADYLEAMVEREPFIKRELLEAVGQVVEDEAKRKFGVYQEQIGRYEAWQPLAEATQEDRVRKGFSPNDPLFRTGGLMNTITHHVELNTVTIGSDSDIMVYQELGTEDIPPRPALAPAMFEAREKIKLMIDEFFLIWLLSKRVKFK